jgi:transcriptional regulator with XRE-family HTH domain
MPMATGAPKIKDRLREVRLAKGMTQQQLAAAAETSWSVVAQIEQGKIPNPRLDTLQALAKALGVTVGGLLGEDAS